MLTKTCIRCGAPERREGRRICTPCYAVDNRKAVKRNTQRPAVRARIAAYNVRYHASPKKRLKALFLNAKSSSKKRGLAFTLTAAWLEAQPVEKCAATGIPFSFERTPEGGTRHPWAPSLDRRDSSKGYTPDNVQVVCWAYNIAKYEFPADVLLRLARAIVDAARNKGV